MTIVTYLADGQVTILITMCGYFPEMLLSSLISVKTPASDVHEQAILGLVTAAHARSGLHRSIDPSGCA
jgi:hypothetical protein